MGFDPEMYFRLMEWETILEVIHIRGRVAFDNSIDYVIHTNEQGHNKPHMHAKYREKEIVIEIGTGIVLEGRLSPQRAQQASKWVLSHKDFLTQKWNELTNGIKIPVR